MYEKRDKKPTLTNLSNLGEFGLIDRLTKDIKLQNKSSELGVGDDAAVIDSNGLKTLISSDILVEGVHFDLRYVPLKHLGYKAAAVNFSDIAAMNALPSQIIVNIALSSRFPLEAVEELYKGIKLACNNYNVDIIGGDTSSSNIGLVISISVIGFAKAEDIVKRNTAKVGDLICVSGDLGAAYAGLVVLEREKAEFLANENMQPKLEGYDYIIERQLKPEPRTDIIKFFKEKNIKPNAMMDISDGLASELKHICKNSNVGCIIEEADIPINQLTFDTAREFKMDPTTYAMNGGEDYELLFTIDKKFQSEIEANDAVKIIGEIKEAKNLILRAKNGAESEIKAQGWDGMKA
jgi:thiamine-monophosphate kinase